MALESVVSPQSIDIALAILIVGFFGISGYIAIRMYSAISLFVWMFSFFAFISAIAVGIDFLFVWIGILLTVIAEAFSLTLYAIYGTKV